VAAHHVPEPFGELRVGVEAQHGVGLGQRDGELRAVPLGEAADGHHLAATGLRDVRRGEQRVDRVLLGLLDEAARVHEDHVGRGAAARGRVRVDQLPAAAREPPGELLRVDLVAGAAQREQGRSPGSSVASRFRHGSQGICRPVDLP
jgi:hypothetical protein